ncbi:MAG: FmdB family zinc ribbon protein [Candidatus Bruticola sp.]
MPIYVYRCSNCHKEVEELQYVSDPPLTTCPNCGTETMHKVVSSVGIIFKGSGFYVTDNPHGNSATDKHSHHTTTENSSSETDKAIKTETSAASSTEGKNSSGAETKKDDSGNKVA